MPPMCYVTHMATNTERVKVFQIDPYVIILGEPGWTTRDWEKAVPADILYNALDHWDYELIQEDGQYIDCWVLDTSLLPHEPEGPLS